MRYRLFCTIGCLLGLAGPQALQAQTAGGWNPLSSEGSGFRLYSVTGSVSYYSLGLPGTLSFSPNTADLSSDVAYSGGATMGWTRTRERSSTAITGSLTYSGRTHYTDLNALEYFLSVRSTRILSHRWRLTLSGITEIISAPNFLFSPTVFSSIAAVPASFDDLASAMLDGNYTNSQLAALLTGAPVIESPARTLLYGYRTLINTGGAAISYSYSPRLGVSWSGSAAQAQHLNSKADATYGHLLDHMYAGTAEAEMIYSLTPRTRLGASVTFYRIVTALQRSSSESETIGIGRTLSRHWFAEAHGGVATVQYPHGGSGASGRALEYVAESRLTFKSRANTMILGGQRTLLEGYGIASGPTVTAQGAWRFHRPGAMWSPFAEVAWQRFHTSFLDRLVAWRGTAGITRNLNSHTSVQAQYAYMTSSGRFNGVLFDQAPSGFSIAVMWTPGNLRQARPQ